MKYKVLFGTYPWAFDCPGGGERQLLAYKEHLAKKHIDVKLFNPWRDIPQSCGIFHYFSVLAGSIHVCNYMKNQKGMKLVVSPNLWVTHETKACYPAHEIWCLLELADKVIVNSDIEGDQLSDVFAIPRAKFATVYNGVETEFLIPADPSLFKQRFALERPYVLCVANVEPRKNMAAFLEAMQQFPEYDFVVIGNVRDEKYADLCRQIGGEHFRFVDALEYNSPLLRSAIAGCTFFAMPSIVETPSIAALEAASAGAKLLITQQGSTREYFGDSAIYLDPLSVESMIAGIKMALNGAVKESHLPFVRDRYLWTKCINDLNRVYNNLLAI